MDKNEKLSFREIFRKHGAAYFRQLESEVLKKIYQEKTAKSFILSCGGGTPLDTNNQILLRHLGKIIFLDADEKVLLPRILKHGVPAFFPYPSDPKKSLSELLVKRRPVYKKVANKIINFKSESPETLVNIILTLIN